MTKGQNIHVVPRNGRWVVRKEGNSQATSEHVTQREAVDTARDLARSGNTEVVIHRRDGRIGSRDSYRSEPLPPKEPRPVLFPESSNTSTSKKAIRKAIKEVVRESRH
jgi:Uncharacterized protein conserved in bacteria (DUF2188)